MSELAVLGCTLAASLDEGVGTISATLAPASMPSQYVLAEGKGVYFDKLVVTVGAGSSVAVSPPPGASSGTGTLAAADTIDILGTAENILDLPSENKAVQKGDKGSKILTFTFPATGGGTVTAPYNVTVEVTEAGQTSVIAS